MYAAVPSTAPVRVAALSLVEGLELGDAEVEDLDEVGPVVATADEQVVRLEIAVNDPGGVRGLIASAGLQTEIGGAADGQPPLALQERGQALADQILHDDVGVPSSEMPKSTAAATCSFSSAPAASASR